MYLSIHLSMLAERLIVMHELSSSLLIETALWKWNNQQTLDHFKYVSKGPLGRIPVSLQGVYTDLPRWLGYVWMENLRHKVALWRLLREPGLECQFAAENTVEIWCLNYTELVKHKQTTVQSYSIQIIRQRSLYMSILDCTYLDQ